MIEMTILEKNMDCASLSDRIMRLEWQIEYCTLCGDEYPPEYIEDLWSQRNKAMSKLEYTRKELLDAQKKQLTEKSRAGVQQ